MSFAKLSRKFQGTRSMTAISVARIEQEGAQILRDVVQSEPAKVVAAKTGMTPRHVYNLRDGECQPRWMHFIALCREYPELRQAVGRWLGYEGTHDPIAADTLAAIRKLLTHGDE